MPSLSVRTLTRAPGSPFARLVTDTGQPLYGAQGAPAEADVTTDTCACGVPGHAIASYSFGLNVESAILCRWHTKEASRLARGPGYWSTVPLGQLRLAGLDDPVA